MKNDDDVIEQDELAALSELDAAESEATDMATRVHVRPKPPTKPRTKAKPGTNAEPAPKSRRAPKSVSKSNRASDAPSKRRAAKSSAPRSRRAPPSRASREADARGEVSIPPTWSNVNEDGDRVTLPEAAFADLTPLSPGTYRAPEDDAASALPVGRGWRSPYVRAAAGLAAAVLCVLGARTVLHRGSGAGHSNAAAVQLAEPPAIAHVETIPPPPEETPDPPAPVESAVDVKKAALAALEQGKLADAVSGAAHATELDPTDAESWLILGAAFQDQGNTVAARQAFASCTKQATKGDVRECSFLLR
jgi:hypothetical protein